MFHTECRDGCGHFFGPDGLDVFLHARRVDEGRVENITAFPTGAGEHHDPVAFVGITGHGSCAFAGLVVGVGVDGEDSSLRHVGLP